MNDTEKPAGTASKIKSLSVSQLCFLIFSYIN